MRVERRAPLTDEDWFIWISLGAYQLESPLYECAISADRIDALHMYELTVLRLHHDGLEKLLEDGEDEEGREVWLLEGYERRRPTAIYDLLDALDDGTQQDMSAPWR